MRKALVVCAVIALSASAASAQYAGAWSQTWDFNTGSGAWALNGGSFWDNTYGGGAIKCVDAANATFTLPAAEKKFVFQVDVAYATTSNPYYLQDSGIGVGRAGDQKGPQIGGTNSNRYGLGGIDTSWDNVLSRKSYALDNSEFAGGFTVSQGKWFTLQIDYGVTTPGKFTTWWYNPGVANYGAGWQKINDTRDVHPTDSFSILRLGGVNVPKYTGSWSQAYFDNAKFVPEPTSIGLLGLGSFGLIRRRRAA